MMDKKGISIKTAGLVGAIAGAAVGAVAGAALSKEENRKKLLEWKDQAIEKLHTLKEKSDDFTKKARKQIEDKIESKSNTKGAARMVS